MMSRWRQWRINSLLVKLAGYQSRRAVLRQAGMDNGWYAEAEGRIKEKLRQLGYKG